MNLSFREKSLWLLVAALLLSYGGYFAAVLPGGADVRARDVALFIGMTALLVVAQIVGHVVLAVAHRRDLAHAVMTDERDAQISLKSSRTGYYVLNVGVCLALIVALVAPGNFLFTHVLLGFWVASAVTELLAQLVLYRRSA